MNADQIFVLTHSQLQRLVAHQLVKIAEADLGHAREIGWIGNIEEAKQELKDARRVKKDVYLRTDAAEETA